MPRVRTGLDYRPALTNREGIGRYARELVRAFVELGEDEQLVLFGSTLARPRFAEPELGLAGSRARLVRRRLPSKLLPHLMRLAGRGADDWLGGVDVFHHTQPNLLPVRRAAEIATIFDCLFMDGAGWVDDRSAARMEHAARSQVARAQLVLVPSAFVARDVEQRLGARAEQIVVTELGCDHAARARSSAPAPAGTPYVLTVCRVDARKNLVRALAAFEQVAARGGPHRWIVAGPPGHGGEAFEAALLRSSLRARVEWRRFVPEAELAALYAGASAFLFPSLGEGFGLPPLEAMVHGVPVVAGAAGSLPEVCGDAALLVDPRDEAAIASALARVLEDEDFARELAHRGRERAARYTWHACARKTLAAYARAAR